eukprot:1686385-Rhodomonas_salina.2
MVAEEHGGGARAGHAPLGDEADDPEPDLLTPAAALQVTPSRPHHRQALTQALPVRLGGIHNPVAQVSAALFRCARHGLGSA